MVPIGMIRKIYGKAVRIEEINKVVTDNIQEYITELRSWIFLAIPFQERMRREKLISIPRIDFTFSFEVGLTPEVVLPLSQKTR